MICCVQKILSKQQQMKQNLSGRPKLLRKNMSTNKLSSPHYCVKQYLILQKSIYKNN